MNRSLVFAAVCILFPLSLFARLSVGPIVGYAKTNGVARIIGMRVPTSTDKGPIAGAAMAFPVFGGVGVQSGIVVSTDGFTIPGLFVTSQNLKAYKLFSFGYGVNAGYELRNGLFIRLGYERGLSNVFSPKSPVEVSFIPYQVNACVGYYIRRKRE